VSTTSLNTGESVVPTTSVSTDETVSSATSAMTGKQLCWNGLGICEAKCPLTDSSKYEPLCSDSKFCCVPKKIVLPIKSFDESGEDESDVHCGLNHGICEIKCLPPTTVYSGSYNECPLRHFCCINDTVSQPSSRKIQ